MTDCATSTQGHEHSDTGSLRNLWQLAPMQLLCSTGQYLMQHQTTNTKQWDRNYPHY
jgi:hypothetical protein